ncbi:MAG: glycoside hydrolase family 97 catalytic domain-containing protein [Pyrinomonadaceae bacterium]|nr:glycoside hydrolase family 97 catalytic domain-containing protein [Sphingobacteriaceae bacterium]
MNLIKARLCIILIACISGSFSILYAQSKSFPKLTTLTSPDGAITLSVLSPDGELKFAIKHKGITVIEPSRLGLVVNGKSFGTNASITGSEQYKLNETYPYRGVHSLATNKCNGARIGISSSTTPFTLEARVFNDGVAFRYVIKNATDAVIERDTTAFTFPSGSMVWSQSNIKYYEGTYSKRKIEQFKAGDPIGPPVIVELPGGLFSAVTEGGLTDFSGMSLRANGANGFNARLAGPVKKKGIIETPWRIIEIGKDLNTLVNCDIIASVSPAYDKKLFPKGYDTDWVKPGRSVWSYLTDRRSITLKNMKVFSDLAAELGFEYNLVDEDWGYWKDGTRDHWDLMKELVDYSAKKGVKIWVWKAYPDRKGIEGLHDPAKRIAFFKKCKEIGIAGMKLDFFDSEDQNIIQFYQDALRDAAKYQLMINFHGANKPTGETRTWPNEMTREAVRGMENRVPWAPSNSILPFTRYLAGHADFTPVHFGKRIGEVTWSHHIATMIIYTSPFLCIGAEPKDILDNPAKDLIKSIPAVWDETIVLPPSKIGELAIYARRKGDTWFIAGVNGVHAEKSLKIDLSFLKKGNYSLTLMRDDKAKQPAAMLENLKVASGSTITIDLNPKGGFAGRFDKVN